MRGKEAKHRKKESGAGAGMHTQNQEKNKPHKRNSCFSRGFFSGEGLLLLQLLQAAQGLSTSSDEATQLDTSLQGGARAQFI